MTPEQVAIQISGHQPGLFTTQKEEILNLLLRNRGNWVPAYSLSAIALQFSARVKERRDAGYVIENKTERHGRQVHGSCRLVACPGETGELNGRH
jgi:hypothetical protein